MCRWRISARQIKEIRKTNQDKSGLINSSVIVSIFVNVPKNAVKLVISNQARHCIWKWWYGCKHIYYIKGYMEVSDRWSSGISWWHAVQWNKLMTWTTKNHKIYVTKKRNLSFRGNCRQSFSLKFLTIKLQYPIICSIQFLHTTSLRIHN